VEASVLHAEKKEGVEPSVEEPEDLNKADAEAVVAVADLEKGIADVAGEDLEKGEAEAVVAEDGGVGVAAPVLADLAKTEEDTVDQKAEAEFVVTKEGDAVGAVLVVADIGKGKEEEVVPEAEVEDGYTAWVIFYPLLNLFPSLCRV
jgi:hypothetical protein